jgi:hypothetical protein
MQAALDGAAPFLHSRLSCIARHTRLEDSIDFPSLGDSVFINPKASRNSGKICGTERGRLGYRWPDHWNAE